MFKEKICFFKLKFLISTNTGYKINRTSKMSWDPPPTLTPNPILGVCWVVFFTLFSNTCPILHLPVLLLRYFRRSWTFQRKCFGKVNKKFEIFGHRNRENLLYAQALSLNIISPTPASHEEVKYLFPVILFTSEHSGFYSGIQR